MVLLDQNILLVAFVFNFVVFVPFMIYCNVQLWRHKQEVYMTKRHVILIACVINCMWAFTIITVMLDSNTCAITSICGTTNFPQQVFIYPLVIGFTARSWFLFYKLTWNETMLNIEWWHHINANRTGNSWILKYKNSLGSFSKCMWKYLLSYALCCIVITVLLVAYHQNAISQIMSSLHVMLSCIITGIILCKVPLFDAFHIRFELNASMTAWTLICLYFGITESLHLVQKYAFFAYAKAWANMLSGGFIAYMTILYPINRLKREEREAQIYLEKMDVTDLNKYVFACASNFNHFMQHLVSEMAVENLCFLLEVFQLKQYHFNSTVISTQHECNFGLFIEIPSDLPQSSIVEECNDLKQQIILLYDKYIINSAELQINISWEEKEGIEQKIASLITNQDENKVKDDTQNEQNDILLIYDEALLSVTKMLYWSFSRFQQSDTHLPHLHLDVVTSETTV